MSKAISENGVRGFLHEPVAASGDALVLTHGAGGNSEAPLLVALAKSFEARGWFVLRCDLPFRQVRASGSPYPAQAPADREGIERAINFVRPLAERTYLSGHSYGGRQATILASEIKKPDAWGVLALLLLSYPLHPPGKRDQLRTAHFPKLRTPSLFAHGSSDGFGSPDEVRDAIALIPARTDLHIVKGQGHGLAPKYADEVSALFAAFVSV